MYIYAFMYSEHVEPKYEHLDMIWADDLPSTIYPRILGLLDQYSDKGGSAEAGVGTHNLS